MTVTHKFVTDKMVEAQWMDLRCGDVITVEEDSVVPADIVLLYSTGQKGTCFVETKSLDGETNLKIKNT